MESEGMETLTKRIDALEAENITLKLQLESLRQRESELRGCLTTSRESLLYKIMDEKLQYKADLESLIARLSTQIINIPTCIVDQGINVALSEIGEFFEADRVGLFLLTDDDACVRQEFEWCADGIEPMIKRDSGFPLNNYLIMLHVLEKGNVIYFSKNGNDNPDFVNVGDIMNERGVKSGIIVPLVYRKNIKGLITFSSVIHERTWPLEAMVA